MENEVDNSISELALENIGENEAELNQIFKIHKSMPQIWPIVTYKRFLFQGVANFRDLGRIYNYKTKEYLELEQEKLVDVKDKQIYRCAVPLSATEKDLELFRELKIKTFIDLRSTREVEAQPFPSSITKFASYKRVEFLSTVKAQLKILTTASKLSASYRLIKSQLTKKGKREALQYFSETVNQFELYKIIAIECGFQIATALKIITEPTNRPVVFFCSHGRDRTGIVAAMVLHCLNVPIELICSEYFLSEEGGFDELIEIKGLKGFCRDTMWLLLNWLENKYGSLSQYLKVMGFGYTWQARLRNQLISNYSSVLESLSTQPLVAPKKGISTSILRDMPSNASPLFSSDKPTLKNYSEVQVTPHSSQSHRPTITINNGQNENSTSPLSIPNNSDNQTQTTSKKLTIVEKPPVDTSSTNTSPVSPSVESNVGNEKIKNSKLVYRHRKNSTSLDLSRKPNQMFTFHDVNISPRSHLENKHKVQINVIDESQNKAPVVDFSSHHHHHLFHHHQEENNQENLSKKEKKEKKEREKKEEKEKEKREKKERKEREKEEKGRLKIDRKERKKISSSVHSNSTYNLNPETPNSPSVNSDNNNNNTSSFKGEPNAVSHTRLMINMSEIPKTPSLQRKEAEKTLKRLEKDCEYKAIEIQSKQQEFERKYLELKKLEIELEKLQKSIREDKSSLAQKESSLLKQLQLTLDIDAPVSPRLNLPSELVEDAPPMVIDQSSKRVHFKKSFTLNDHIVPEKSASIPKNLKENRDN